MNYFTDERYELGVENITDSKNQFRIYEIEKTVVDIVCYQEKVGIEETTEIIIFSQNLDLQRDVWRRQKKLI